MKLQGTLSLATIYLLIFLAILACTSSFYILNSYLSTPSWYTIPDSNPLSLSMPDGNCSCTATYLSLSGTSQLLPERASALSCNCNKSTADAHLQGGNGIKSQVNLECPICPPQEKVEAEGAKACPGAPWYAEGKEWHSPPKFPMCSMDACFDYSKCDNMTELLVYTYDLPSPPLRYFDRIKESSYWTENPKKACLFFVFLDTKSPWPMSPKELPHWNGGLNHVLITFADKWENRNPPAHSIEMASIMGTIVFQTTNRAGFDIAIPLPGKAHITDLQSVPAFRRKYLATFRGTRYLGESGEGVFRSFDSFRGMHNGEDVVVVTSCRHATNDLIRKERPHLGVYCDEDAELYSSYDFYDLMNTTFGIVPAGRQPSSFRFIEVLSAGAIPVLIADNYVKPFETLVHWHKCLLQFPTSQMQRIVPALRALRMEDVVKRQENCLRIYKEFLKDYDALQDAAMRALKERFMGVIPSFARV